MVKRNSNCGRVGGRGVDKSGTAKKAPSGSACIGLLLLTSKIGESGPTLVKPSPTRTASYRQSRALDSLNPGQGWLFLASHSIDAVQPALEELGLLGMLGGSCKIRV